MSLTLARGMSWEGSPRSGVRVGRESGVKEKCHVIMSDVLIKLMTAAAIMRKKQRVPLWCITDHTRGQTGSFPRP